MSESLCFVVPAHRRIQLSAICFAQMADACKTLREGGIDAQVVVIADDENLDLAHEHRLASIRHPNMIGSLALGAKWNAGYAWAAKEGFDCVAALGSDSWIEPSRYLTYELPQMGEMVCTRNYVAVHHSGARQARLRIGYDGGIGTRVFRTAMLANCGHAPIEGSRESGCDTATLNSLRAHQRVQLLYTDLHQFEVVGFQSRQVQITSYSELVRLWLVKEVNDGCAGLEHFFKPQFVEAIRAYYG